MRRFLCMRLGVAHGIVNPRGPSARMRGDTDGGGRRMKKFYRTLRGPGVRPGIKKQDGGGGPPASCSPCAPHRARIFPRSRRESRAG